MREVVLDLETTGFEPSQGHKIIEIGCVEIIDGIISRDNYYHQYVNPERDVPYSSYKVHGISEEFLKDKPVFSEIVADFLAYIDKDMLVIHNAEFDMKFLNYELGKINLPKINVLRAKDTLQLARDKLPGKSASLDQLCRYYDIDLSARHKHGALLDSQLLSEVYIELLGGKQLRMDLSKEKPNGDQDKRTKKYRESRNYQLSEEEITKHYNFINKITNPIWKELQQ